jgi:hypothetical protein
MMHGQKNIKLCVRILNPHCRIRTWVLHNTKSDILLRPRYTAIGHRLNPLNDSSIPVAHILSDSQIKPMMCKGTQRNSALLLNSTLGKAAPS